MVCEFTHFEGKFGVQHAAEGSAADRSDEHRWRRQRPHPQITGPMRGRLREYTRRLDQSGGASGNILGVSTNQGASGNILGVSTNQEALQGIYSAYRPIRRHFREYNRRLDQSGGASGNILDVFTNQVGTEGIYLGTGLIRWEL